MDWVKQSDIQDFLVLPSNEALPTKPFSLPLFSLDYGRAWLAPRLCDFAHDQDSVKAIFVL
jgi:hypothetical protein